MNENNSFSLPDLISSLGHLENGKGLFSKNSYDKIQPTSIQLSKSLSLRPSSSIQQHQIAEKPKTAIAGQTTATSEKKNNKERNSYQKVLNRTHSSIRLDVEHEDEEEEEENSSILPPPRGHSAADIEIPEHILQFKKDWEEVHENRLRLPLLRQLSPHLRKKASLLPPPNSRDLAKLSEYEKIGKKHNSPHLYKQLNELARKDQIKRYQSGTPLVPTQLSDTTNEPIFKKEHDVFGDKKEVVLGHNSTSVYDDVKARKSRKMEQLQRVSVFATPDDGWSDTSSSVVSKRAISPKIKSYPFQTPLTNLLSAADSKLNDLKGRSPPPEKDKAKKETTSSVPLETSENLMKKEYVPLLQELTDATNDLLKSYGVVAKEYNSQALRQHQSKKENTQFMNHWKTSLYDELGVNVDPVYTAKVKYGRAVTMIIYYTITMKLKFALSQWKEFSHEMTRRRKIWAGALLTRIAKGMLSRMAVREMRYLRQKQREAEEEYERQRMIFRNFMCYKITKAWRRHLKRKQRKIKEQRRKACVRIQSRVRGMLARTYVAWLRIYRQRCLASAIKIQSAYRMHLAVRKLTLLRKMEYVRQWELSRAEKHMLRRMNYRLHGAAISVSRAYRAHTIHSRLQSLLYWNRFAKALQIQCLYRGYVVRKRYYRLILAKKRREAERNRAATVIQSQVRMRQALRLFYQMQEVHREKREKRLKRKKKLLKDKYLTVGEYKLNMTNAIRNSRAILRSMMPLRYIWERVNARTIQRYWRGHKARKRALLMKVHMRVREVYAKRERREASAIKIQKVYRGHMRRHMMRKELWARKAIVIQCYWRRKAARREANLRRQKLIALGVIRKSMTVLVLGMRARQRFRLEKLYSRHVVKLQRLARKYLGRVFLRNRKDRLRLHEDGLASASLTTLRLMSSIQLMLLKESCARDIGSKARILSGSQCYCYGPVQALFVSALGKKGRPDPELLSSNRMDTSSLQKLITRVEDLSVPPDKRERKKSKLSKAKSMVLDEDTLTLMLFHAIRISIIRLPKVAKAMSSSDVDILFNKYKGAVGGNMINYLEFVSLLGGIGEFCLEKLPLSRQLSYEVSKETRPASPPGNAVPPSIGSPMTTSNSNGVDKPSSPLQSSQIVSKSAKKSAQKLSIRSAITRYLYHPHNLIVNKEGQPLAILLLMLLACESDPWMENVVKWMTSEAYARVALIIVPIQQMVRSKIARARVRRRKVEKAKEDDIKKVAHSVLRLQQLVRRRLQWKITAQIAQKTLIKYIPSSGPPYWYHPKTRISSYKKPKILGSYECLEVPLPAPKLEYIITCGNCEINEAQINCLDCEDSMCKTCFSTLHYKGKKRFHQYQQIQHCSLCRYQMATKSCMTCSLRKPDSRSCQALIEGDRGILCDTCYIHIHTSESVVGPKKKAVSHVTVNSGTKDAYLISQSLNERLHTNHRYRSLVQVCEECQWRGASYRCEDCDQIYCNKCLIGFHSIGGPFAKHKAEKLPYFTPDMAKKYEKAMFEKRLQLKIERVAQAYAHKAQELRVMSAIKLQSWWRMILGRRKGRAFMKEKRMTIRRRARLRKYEDYTYRSTLWYQIRNIFGFAPKLSSDTLEERILGKHHLFARDRIRHYINNNVDDWGYFYVQSKKRFHRTGQGEITPLGRKGVPKTGFQVGRFIELQDQATRGGYRLPGKIHMIRGEKCHQVNMDISSLLQRGQYIRIGRQLFILMKVDGLNITFNRRWRFPDRKNMPIYLLPCYRGERHRRYYKSRIMLYDLIVGNQLTQATLQGYKAFYDYLNVKSLDMARSNKRIGLMINAQKWKQRAENYQIKSKWAENLIADDGGSDHISLGSGSDAKTKSTNTSGVPKKSRKPEDRVPGELWEATDEEKDLRKQKERKMTRQELLDEAPLWEERYEPVLGKAMWVNVETLEVTYEMPKAVKTKEEMKKEEEKKQLEFMETQKRLTQMSKMKKKR